MAREFNGSSQYLLQTATIPGLSSNADSYTLHAWVYPDGTSGVRNFYSSGNGTAGYSTQLRQDGPDWNFYHYSGVADINARHTGGVSAGSWVAVGGSWDGVNIKLYTGGTLRATTAIATRARAGSNHFIGAAGNEPSSPLQFWDGRIAEVSVWNATLSDIEIASLAAGISPLRVRPANLQTYFPLIRELKDYKRGAWTDVGSTTVVSHPRMFYPATPIIREYVASVVTPATTQEGYRWREDNENQSDATWLAIQDTNVSREKEVTTRLRVLTDTNDAEPPAEALKLQYRRVGDPDWLDVI